MQRISERFATIVAVVVVCGMSSAHGAIIDQYNETATTFANMWGVASNEVGWYYTPSQTFDLTGVETRFDGSGTPGTVTLEIFAAGLTAPFNPPAPIFTDTFSSAVTPTWSGVTGIVGGPQLDAGSTYFIGFRNVTGIGVNFTGDGGADVLTFAGDNSGTYNGGAAIPEMNQPILRISGDAVGAPEPGSAVVLLAGSLLLARRRARA